jgi:hypothetical protein
MYNQHENVPFAWGHVPQRQNHESLLPEEQAQRGEYRERYLQAEHPSYESYNRYGQVSESSTQQVIQDPIRQPTVDYPTTVSTDDAYFGLTVEGGIW